MNKNRIVVKLGSNVLTRPDGKLDTTRVSAIVDQIVWLRRKGWQVVLVTSGAVASGRGEVPTEHPQDSVGQRQLFSAIGQVKLVGLYYDLFREYGVSVGQVLTMKENFAPGRQYDTQRQCIEVMLAHGVLPIVNENDTVCVTELMFTDNDELSSLVARMADAATLIILSNIDGLYTGDPGDPASQLIRRVAPSDTVEQYIQASKSRAGRGGMQSKIAVARAMQAEGRRVVIANGRKDKIIEEIITRTSEEFTDFAGQTD